MAEEGGGPLPIPAGWNVLGVGVRGEQPSRRDVVRKRPVLQQLEHLTRKLTLKSRDPIEHPKKFRRTEQRRSGIEDLIAAARALGLPLLSVRRTIQAVEKRLGIDTSLRQIERGRAPDLSVLAAATAAPQPPAPLPSGTTFPSTQPAPAPTGTRAPPGLPQSWWDWQLWQRALYGGLFAAGLFKRQPSAGGGGGTIRIVLPRAQAPAPILAPQPVATTRLGEPMPAFSFTGSGQNDSLWGSVGSGDFWGALEAGIGLAGGIFGQQPVTSTRSFLPAVLAGPVGRAVLGGAAGAAGVGLLEGFLGDDSPAAPQLFRATDTRILPRARIDAVGPDGRCYTWFRAVPYGWKVRGTKVGGRKRHHHHYRKR